MTRVWMSFLVMAVCVLLCSTVYGVEEPTAETDGLCVTALGSDDLLSLRAGVRPWQGRTEIGLFGVWLDGLAEGEQEAYGGGVYATYDVVESADFTILSATVPVTWYAGGQLGVLHREDSDEDATAAVMTGFSFGGERVRIGIEYQYLLDEALWKEFGRVDDQGRLLLRMQYRW